MTQNQAILEPLRTQAWALFRHPAVRYVVVGGGTFLTDLGCLMVLHGEVRLPLPLATAISYVIATVANFLANRSFTYSSSGVARPAARYLALVGVNLLLSVVLISALSDGLGLDYRASKLGISAAAMAWNYFAYRLWVFV